VRYCLECFTELLEENVTNPFEDENGTYHVLINEEGQHSLWPSFVEVPNGWTIILKSDTRTTCLEFINKNWTDMRPRSLIAAMESQVEGEQHKTNQNGSGIGPTQHNGSATGAETSHRARENND
jgi:MbtH protein